MEVLWRTPGPMAAEAIREQLAEDWSEATVRTLLTRLVKKKAAAQAKDGRRFLYTALVARADHARAEGASLIDRLFDGQLGPFVTQFAEQRTLTRDDIARLKALIAELDNDR
ncbi:MAG: beta-lactamase [Caulobacteraceae bacterium]|jgi:BlaI family penicillinase repressor|nr:beta-lactamase [Caulobacteraceae bacterium]